MTPELDSILADFDLIEDWDERYRYLIELGRDLKPLDDAARSETNKVRGCASQVWIETLPQTDGTLVFNGDSDAHIVKGLVRLTLAIYSGQRPQTIISTDAGVVFEKLGLSQHLTPQRSNGVRAMVERIKADAHKYKPRGMIASALRSGHAHILSGRRWLGEPGLDRHALRIHLP